MSQEEQNRLDIRALEIKFSFIQDALKENNQLLQKLNDKMDTRLSRVESHVSSLRAQLKLIGSLLAIIITSIVGLIFFRL
jgi:uncharacterized protein (UPF0210 family)